MTEEQPKKTIDVGGLHEELQAAGLPVKGVDSNGRITWYANPTGQQVASAAQIAAQHKGKPVKGEQRETAGITHEAMVEALWEKVFSALIQKRRSCCRKWQRVEIEE
jgi:hypothetical protein